MTVMDFNTCTLKKIHGAIKGRRLEVLYKRVPINQCNRNKWIRKTFATSNVMIDSGKDHQHTLNFHRAKLYWVKQGSQSLKTSHCKYLSNEEIQRYSLGQVIKLSVTNKEN